MGIACIIGSPRSFINQDRRSPSTIEKGGETGYIENHSRPIAPLRITSFRRSDLDTLDPSLELPVVLDGTVGGAVAGAGGR